MGKKTGLRRESNPRPLAPEARIIPLDHKAITAAHNETIIDNNLTLFTILVFESVARDGNRK